MDMTMDPKPLAAEFQEAFEQAHRIYGAAWEILQASDRVTAIYREMRRIDAERFGVRPFNPLELNRGLVRRYRQKALYAVDLAVTEAA